MEDGGKGSHFRDNLKIRLTRLPYSMDVNIKRASYEDSMLFGL